ncbi:MAG TPA: phosphate ABC transporter permease subunit PstC, partial [Pseudomonas sp.]|nr:phosphate ABC transporter permease subunit PstC [Pseudomonas sp.]
MTDQTLPLSAAQEERIRRDTRADTWFRRLLFSAALLVLAVLVGAALSTLWGGRLAFMTFGLDFLTSAEWDVGAEKFGALVPIYGTLMT